ncbi:palmitoyltransferase ERF2 [Kluyveromyces lactis]|uniref:Palmitoyltransferase ERF2 n=1 Tax=Kluyveromyces lactis (strain ATCC 8585 / CBS 2359 / DSM 70799 / NBRC 1267 / NRRL Y-1140 / WM37) TaxID=284590 RepID=ERFB_KLULA|nr:uncharacterized protein KLLA0_D18370g [Kluyveromyces lactis]Q6CQB5.1 RecName: Full=Palmitoyltransferase ERF2; AltName: Full=DHHC cysteine-rich domain-containing protein ERF2; AltName: Full=Ras protein acyltransferase [Kluyveromyces lactis NRRL Y-1140]CAH00970.1 KLLA0D18370p [Kluyveromyces lactis]|eukprot:XP_453874.1 uncharacterized protein KLLA0_D18370g [Kluyveromyces lactis]
MIERFMRNDKDRPSARDGQQNGTNDDSYFVKFLHWIITLDTYDGSSRNYGRMTETTNYTFFFGGRVRTVTKTSVYSIVVFAMFIVPLILFSIFECNYLWHHKGTNWKPAIVILYYFYLLTICSFLRAACSDPGIVPRNVHIPDLNASYKIPQEYYNYAILPTKNPNASVSMKYCQTCRIWRPPRSAHCSVCDVCVLSHDHHCKWLNNCIGKRNYRFFLEFLMASTISCILLILLSSFRLSYSPQVRYTPVSLLIICYCGLGIWYPLILFIYHIFLAGTQQTTHEYLRSIGSKHPIFHKITRNRDSPYDRNSMFFNLIHLWFQERGWNLVDPRRKQHYPADIRFRKLPEAHSFETV